MVPIPGSTMNGGKSGFPMRSDIKLLRALESLAELLPGQDLPLSSVSKDIQSSLQKNNF